VPDHDHLKHKATEDEIMKIIGQKSDS